MASVTQIHLQLYRVRYSLRLPGGRVRRERKVRARATATPLRRELEALEGAVIAGHARLEDVDEWVRRGYLSHTEAVAAFAEYREARVDGGRRAAVDLAQLQAEYERYALEHSKAQDADRKSHRNRMGLARQVLDWLRAEHPTLELSPRDVTDWLARLSARGYSEWSRHHYLQQLRILLDLAQQLGMAHHNAARQCRLPQPRRQVPRRILSGPEIQRLLDVSLRYRARIHGGLPTVVRLGLYAGLRDEEMCWLTWEALDLDACVLHVQAITAPHGETWRPKDAELRSIDMKPALVDYLHAERARQREMQLPGPFVLVAGHARQPQYRGRPVGSSAIQHAFAAMVRAEALDSAITIYSMRHTFCTALLRAGVDIETVRDRMGHADIRTTQGYLHAIKPEAHPLDALPY